MAMSRTAIADGHRGSTVWGRALAELRIVLHADIQHARQRKNRPQSSGAIRHLKLSEAA